MAQAAMPGARESLRPRAAERSLRARHPSHRLTASIYCEIDGLPVEIEPLELSTAGLFVETPAPLPVDSEVEVFIRIGTVRFEASGTVVQTISCEEAKITHRKPGYGLLFTHLDDGARGVLRRGMEALVFQRANKERTPPNTTLNVKSDAERAAPEAAAPTSTSARTASSNPMSKLSMNAPPSARASAASAPPVTKSTAVSMRPAPKSARASAPDPQEQVVIERLRGELKALDGQAPWAILGIAQGTALPEAKLAFFNASKRYHPHLFARYAAPEIKQLVTQLFIAHKRAYDALKKSGKSTPRASLVDAPRIGRTPASRQPGSGNK